MNTLKVNLDGRGIATIRAMNVRVPSVGEHVTHEGERYRVTDVTTHFQAQGTTDGQSFEVTTERL